MREPEAQALEPVHGAQIIRDDFLTSAFLQTCSSPVSKSVADYLLNRKANIKYQNVCVGFTEIDTRMVAVWLLVALVLSSSAGVAAGVLWRNTGLGFDIGMCTLAVLSTLQGVILLWQI